MREIIQGIINKPCDCPFCGSRDVLLQKDIGMNNMPARRYFCNSCGARQHFSLNRNPVFAERSALYVWNKRN